MLQLDPPADPAPRVPPLDLCKIYQSRVCWSLSPIHTSINRLSTAAGRQERGHHDGAHPAGGAHDGHTLRWVGGWVGGCAGGWVDGWLPAGWHALQVSAPALPSRQRCITPQRRPTPACHVTPSPHCRRHRPSHHPLPSLPRHERQGNRHAAEQEERVPGAGRCAAHDGRWARWGGPLWKCARVDACVGGALSDVRSAGAASGPAPRWLLCRGLQAGVASGGSSIWKAFERMGRS